MSLKQLWHVSNALSQNLFKILAFYLNYFGMIIPLKHSDLLILIERGLNIMKVYILKYMNRLRLLTITCHASVATISPLKAHPFRQTCHLISAQEVAHA
jgi:hypothetical protein